MNLHRSTLVCMCVCVRSQARPTRSRIRLVSLKKKKEAKSAHAQTEADARLPTNSVCLDLLMRIQSRAHVDLSAAPSDHPPSKRHRRRDRAPDKTKNRTLSQGLR